MLEFLFEWMPVIWLLAAILLAVAEAMTVQLVAIWFAVAAVVAILPALLKLPIEVQFLAFFVVAGAMLIFTRPYVNGKLKKEIVHTNADGNIGKIGIVSIALDPAKGGGRIVVSGQDWAARSEEEDFISEGEQVVIKEIQGVTMLVEHLL